MPKALNADWNLAQVLYSQGVPYKVIAEKVGVTEMSLRQRSHRHGWHALKTAALQTVSQAVTRHGGKTLAQRSQEVRAVLAEEVEESAKALRQTPVKPSLAHLNERAEVTQKLVASAAKVHAWDSEAPRGIVIVGEIEQADTLLERGVVECEGVRDEPCK